MAAEAPTPPTHASTSSSQTSVTPEREPAPASTATTAAVPRDGNGPAEIPSPEADARISVELPSGSVAPLSFAAGAVTIDRLRRRRNYRPSPPRPGLDTTPPPRTATTDMTRTAHQAEIIAAEPSGNAPPPLPRPGDPLPARAPVGERDGEVVHLDFAATGALAVDGPAAAEAVRAMVVALVAGAGPTDVEVVATPDAWAELRLSVEPFPGLLRQDLASLLSEAEVELVRRTRLFDTASTTTFSAHRQADPGEPLSARVLVTTSVPGDQVGRLNAVAALGQRLGIGVVICGSLRGARQLVVDAKGMVVTDDGGDLVTARLFRLTAEDAGDLLATLGRPRDESEPPSRAEEKDHERSFANGAPTVESPGQAAPILVRLLGPFEIRLCDEELRRGLRSAARELLASCLVHPEGRSQEAAIEALWPEVDPERGSEYFWNALSNLRTRIRQAAPDLEAKLIDRQGDVYRIAETDLFEVDLWSLQAALADVEPAPDDKSRAAVLERAASYYRGDLLEGAYYSWVETAREHLRQRVLDALVRLAELREGAGEREAAIAALDRAIGAHARLSSIANSGPHGQHATSCPISCRQRRGSREAWLHSSLPEPSPGSAALRVRAA